MIENVFESFIRHCGTLNQAAKVLGTSREHVSAMKRGVININLKYALLTQQYMREKADTVINLFDLLSPYDRYALKKLTILPADPPIKLIKISINNIIFDQETIKPINKNQVNLNELRPVIIDENQKIIANSSTYLNYLQQNKKTIPAWQLSFQDLLEKKYSTDILKQTFFICERSAIGIAIKKHLGNRQGKRSDLKLRRDFDKVKVKGRTDDLLASLLALKNKDTYRQVEKIQLLGSEELIRAVNNKNITIANAIKLVQPSCKRQLTFPKKEPPPILFVEKNGRYKKLKQQL